MAASIVRRGLALGLSACLIGGLGLAIPSAGAEPQQPPAGKQPARKKGTAGTTGAPAKGDDAMGGEGGMPPFAKAAMNPANASDLSFKRDIAPILVANCLGCHSGNGQGVRNGRLDMTTFDKLMAGGKRGKDIIAGDPESSHLVLMVKEEETPKMPPNGGQRGFSDEAATKLETWVRQGARLDAGLASADPITKYAATVDDLRRAELDKLTPEQRDKVAEEAGRARWKKAAPKLEPELTTGTHFLLLGNLPKERAKRLVGALDKQFDVANRLLAAGGPGGKPVLASSEKIGLYVFKDNGTFVEFVRANENQDVEAGELARAKLNVESPYIAAVDPAAGGEEAAPAAAAKKSARSKRKKDAAEESTGGPERTTLGLLTEQLVAGAANRAGKPPRWVSAGLGAYAASQVEPASPYFRRLRAEAADAYRIGWIPKANEALGGEGSVETTRAIGFAVFDWMAANGSAPLVANFVGVMLGGQNKLDEAIGNCLGANREEFLTNTGQWVAQHYGN